MAIQALHLNAIAFTPTAAARFAVSLKLKHKQLKHFQLFKNRHRIVWAVTVTRTRSDS